MNCATDKKLKRWMVYDAKLKRYLHLTCEEFGELIADVPLKLIGRDIYDKAEGKVVWVDAMLNSSFFK